MSKDNAFVFFSASERMSVPIHQIPHPAFNKLKNYGSDTKYADYAGMARKFKPKKILEFGVFAGYSACAMILGARAAKMEPFVLGIDKEREVENTNKLALENVEKLCSGAKMEIIKEDINGLWLLRKIRKQAPFDFVHVDADHSEDGTLLQLVLAALVVREKGFVIVDDMENKGVLDGVLKFIDIFAPDCQFQRYDNENQWIILRGVSCGPVPEWEEECTTP